MAYTTLDFIPDLTPTERSSARTLTFQPYTPTNKDIPWDRNATVYGGDAGALSHSLYSFTATAGATYDIFSISYYDPFQLRIYDSSGNALMINDERYDPDDIKLDNGSYSVDTIWEWEAPYTGTYYVNASWNQSSVFTFYDLDIFEDRGTSPNIYGPNGSDQLWGGLNNDTIDGGAGADTIIALDGDDSVQGGVGNDDVNGNVGADTVRGGEGDDWVRGGKGNDTIYGDAGNDPHVNGNIGNDSVSGGDGDDTVYGGQDNDTLYGDAGNDLLSGDIGVDILFGGLGADRFTIRAGGGVDWVGDFNLAQGDRVQLAPGTAYTLTTYEGQVMIDLGNGDRLGLAGVSSVSGDWLVYA